MRTSFDVAQLKKTKQKEQSTRKKFSARMNGSKEKSKSRKRKEMQSLERTLNANEMMPEG